MNQITVHVQCRIDLAEVSKVLTEHQIKALMYGISQVAAAQSTIHKP